MGSLTATSEGIYFNNSPNSASGYPTGYYRDGALQTHASLGSNGQAYVDHRINRYIDAIYTNGEDTIIVLISIYCSSGRGSSIQVRDPDTSSFITTATIANPTSAGLFITTVGTLWTIIRPRQQWRYVTADGYAEPGVVDLWCETNPGTNPSYSITP